MLKYYTQSTCSIRQNLNDSCFQKGKPIDAGGFSTVEYDHRTALLVVSVVHPIPLLERIASLLKVAIRLGEESLLKLDRRRRTKECLR